MSEEVSGSKDFLTLGEAYGKALNFKVLILSLLAEKVGLAGAKRIRAKVINAFIL